MNVLEAIILGIVQGLTEFLPVSSSGHLEIGKELLGVEVKDNILFTVTVHFATVLSTIVVFHKNIREIIRGLLKFSWNEETKYFVKILISMIPVAIIGLFFKDEIKLLFTGKIFLVGLMLITTGGLLTLSVYIKSKRREMSFFRVFIIGIAQAVAILPGISRSGATISVGLLLGAKREKIAKFSFLMVLIPIIGETFLDIMKGDCTNSDIGMLPLIAGFFSSFIFGLIACKWMLKIVKKGKLIYFAIYCAITGATLIFYFF